MAVERLLDNAAAIPTTSRLEHAEPMDRAGKRRASEWLRADKGSDALDDALTELEDKRMRVVGDVLHSFPPKAARGVCAAARRACDGVIDEDGRHGGVHVRVRVCVCAERVQLQ